jgi:hypothetical protein
MTALQLLRTADSDAMMRLGVIGDIRTVEPPQAGKFDNRPTWDNVTGGGRHDNRRTWDNWDNRNFDNTWNKKKR